MGCSFVLLLHNTHTQVMFLRRSGRCLSSTALLGGMVGSSSALHDVKRDIFSDKVRAGMVLAVDKRYYRVTANSRSQKGQNAASFNIKLSEVGTGKKKEVTAGQGHDFTEVRCERVRLLFSGFDDDDQACFVFPEHSAEAGKEVNIKGDSLPEVQQKYLAVSMPVDILHIMPEDESGNEAKDVWAEVIMPTNYVYTVERITLKGLYKMASFVECDGVVSVNDGVQALEKVRVNFKPDGTAAFAGKASS
ncbi:bacterial-type elongation factor P-like protein, putative [Bodo saltans]|uniref:Bacterial-type elongation factor P-like protein, putative n=1 Tax=Bodo saltans TaxID=75058 RepID=A0A0S4IL43_BODSA|nr:bacterial-type elongation factor P-like protein, putative [Bodo saltans]|eukprot:CUE68944.1 bacterial-type elongation factor P-like protein, putative [Bodo saltans]